MDPEKELTSLQKSQLKEIIQLSCRLMTSMAPALTMAEYKTVVRMIDSFLGMEICKPDFNTYIQDAKSPASECLGSLMAWWIELIDYLDDYISGDEGSPIVEACINCLAMLGAFRQIILDADDEEQLAVTG